MTGVFAVNLGLPVWVAVALGILIGAVVGLISGAAIAKLKIPIYCNVSYDDDCEGVGTCYFESHSNLFHFYTKL